MRLLAALVAPVVVAGGTVSWLAADAEPALEPVAGVATSISRVDTGRLAEQSSSRAAMRLGRLPATSLAAGHTTTVDPPDAAVGSLGVTIDELTPGVVPKRGPVVVRGTVTNLTEDTWTGINVYPCTSSSPMLDEATLAEAADSEADSVVCERIDLFDQIDQLAPGATKSYRVRIPRDELRIGEAPGVYWFNVQALGASPDGDDMVSDGRARSFLPLVDTRRTATTSLVVPFRRSTLHDTEGRLLDEDAWAADLAPGGRLRDLLALVEGAPARSISLLVDPAVLLAVEQLAGGNQERSLAPADETTKEPAATEEQDRTASDAEQLARDWLTRFRQVAADQTLLALPYGDLDVAAAASHAPGSYERAVSQSAGILDHFRLQGTPTVAPPGGLLSDEALDLISPSTTILLSDRALPAAYDEDPAPPASVRFDGHQVITYPSSVALGGPDPSAALSPLGLRQRILADAALRAGDGDDRPLAVVLPADLDPGALPDDFWSGLEQRHVHLSSSLAGTREPLVGQLSYPPRQAALELGADVFAIGDRLIGLGATLDQVLPETDLVSGTAVREALSGASYLARDPELETATRLDEAAGWYAGQLDQIGVDAPKFVILSSERGPFSVTITNDLDQPIKVGIRAEADAGLVIRAPKAIEVPANSQHTLNLSAEASEIGVHGVVLVVTDGDGHLIQQSPEVRIRSNEVGKVIWLILGGGIALLFGAIVIRLSRRIRRARAA